MKTLLAALLLIAATPALANGQCFHDQDDPTWTLTETESGFLWKQGAKTEELDDTSAGAGVPNRILVDTDLNAYRYMYLNGYLIVEMAVYEPGCDEGAD